MRRRPTQELLDTDSGTPKEVTDSLIDLRWFNRWFGGIATVRDMVRSIIQRTKATRLSMLEVAAGEGYILKCIHEELTTTEVDLEITLLDRVQAHLPANGSFPKVAGDALSLPFADGTFDVVFCSLFVHHLAPEQVVLFAKEALRVCRIAFLVHDLIRSPLHLALAYAGLPFYRSHLTRNDAPASVWQAYTVEEMEDFAYAAGATKLDAQKHYFYRMGVIAWKGPRQSE